MTKRIAILGSTGSIGRQALKVIAMQAYEVEALAAYSNVALMEEQIRATRPRIAAMVEESAAADLTIRVADTPTRILSGLDGLCACAALPSADIVLNAVVGMVGLRPTLAAVDAGKTIALANKETLVTGGALLMNAVKRRGVRIFPVDSEHSAIFQCLEGCPDKSALSKLILTASGGPFFGKTARELERMTPRDALAHPNWSMGAKITIDSATMVNKGLELIEAAWLFDMPPDRIDIVVHRESVIHSMVEFTDHSVIAQLGVPDMAIPIQYALTWPQRLPSPAAQLDLAQIGRLTFFPPDDTAFPGMNLCRRAISKGGLYPAVVNGANERAVELFLQEKIRFTDISMLAESAMENAPDKKNHTLDDVFEADAWARSFVSSRTTTNQ